jgi:predicted 3-demethylubiquinone-9 3-methyltransferase (glyoxalase superfamily)
MATKRKTPAKAKAKPRTKPRAAIAAPVLSPCLWFDTEAEEAARFYVSVFKPAKITAITKYPAVGQDIHGKPAGSVMTVEFTLNGMEFLALNGGPIFKFNEAISLQILCKTQEQIDYYWEKLSAVPQAEACGWLKDKYGVSWQVSPTGMADMLRKPSAGGTRAFAAMMKMKKLDLAALKAAYKG